jgi:hypothetical protein
METAQWQWRTEHGRFLWLWQLSETCLNVCIVYTNVTQNKKTFWQYKWFENPNNNGYKEIQLTSSTAFISGNVISIALFSCSCCVSVASCFILITSLPSWKQYIINCSETGILHLWGDHFECTWNVGNYSYTVWKLNTVNSHYIKLTPTKALKYQFYLEVASEFEPLCFTQKYPKCRGFEINCLPFGVNITRLVLEMLQVSVTLQQTKLHI